MLQIAYCPVCGGRKFSFSEILWPELVNDWQLSTDEVKYINRQQGFSCTDCGNNLRSMAIAEAILRVYRFSSTLKQFVESDLSKDITILEVNEAGGLSSVLKKMSHYRFVRYPEYNMVNLDLESNLFDLVVHSDTLEHVSDPITGLSECRRILKENGRCVFTVPVIVGRLSRSRVGMKRSYHGAPSASVLSDYIVYTEFGADVWRFALEAGFTRVRIHCLEYPSGLAIEAAL